MEGNFCSRTLSFANDFNLLGYFATREFHLVNFTFATDFRSELIGESVHALGTDAVQSAGNLVSSFIEFSTRVKIG